jgi:cytochrome c oxidase cbb3-type subunit III
MDDRGTGAPGDVGTTGHEWDGIKELNNPLPRWWLWTFYATIIWSIGYVVAYPAIPLVADATKGLLGYSSRGDLATELDRARTEKGEMLARVAAAPLQEIADDPALYRFATSGGRSAFKVHCSQCHGAGAAGSAGYPNLNDDDWLWSGSLDGIAFTISHGVRFDQDDDTRASEMPAFGRDDMLDKPAIDQIAAYVGALAGHAHDDRLARQGAALYAENCAACHGPKGEGDREQGGPRLTDPIWLYGASTGEIAAQIHTPKHGVMPAWGGRLEKTVIKQLTIYVHGLGGGE